MNDDVKEMEKVVAGGSAGPRKVVKSPLEVEVVATRDWDDGVKFMLRWEHPSGVWNSGPMIFAVGDLDRKIEYNLIDQTNLDLAFESVADDCIWVNETGCPVTSPGSDKGQIKDKDRASDKKLKLKNVNDTTYKLFYALRFTGLPWTNGDGVTFGPKYAYDPEYRNGGGGGSNT